MPLWAEDWGPDGPFLVAWYLADLETVLRTKIWFPEGYLQQKQRLSPYLQIIEHHASFPYPYHITDLANAIL